VIPITQELGIDHPQEGVLNGHFLPSASAKQQSIHQLQKGVLLPVHHYELTPSGSSKNTVADLITGYGVAESIRHYYDIYGGALAGKRVLIQGWGNVASAAACYLAHQGARVVGIIDRVGGLLRPEGFSLEEIKELYNARSSNYLEADDLLSFQEINEKIWDVGAEVFLPAAASRLVTRDQVDRLLAGGLEVMASGANVPFADQEIFYGPIASYADSQLSCIPDFISNCGMARVFAYLMKPGADVTDQAIFQDVSEAIASALRKTHNQNPHHLEITKTAYEVALQQLV
jgi:glutamate dehydrogenase/leucine dehydrogenase